MSTTANPIRTLVVAAEVEVRARIEFEGDVWVVDSTKITGRDDNLVRFEVTLADKPEIDDVFVADADEMVTVLS